MPTSRSGADRAGRASAAAGDADGSAHPAAGLGRVLITGGASGLGAAVADAVAKHGGEPIVFDRVPPSARHEFVVVDLADTARTQHAVAHVAEQGLDAVVTCAGVDSCGPMSEVDWQDWERVVRVNLFGTAAVVRAALPALQASRGAVVTVASTLGLRALPEATAYSAAKFAVVGMSRALGAELAGQVRVTCLVPAGMRTAFFDGRPAKYRPGPDAPLMDPADVAETVIDVLSARGTGIVRELVITAPGEPSWP
jgi:NAD(P)-dependent dehydrogenase (short-subunit alcohol dehydrogenase family)